MNRYMKRLVKNIVCAMGYEISARPIGSSSSDEAPRMHFDMEDEAREHIELVRENTMLPYPRLVTLWQQAVHCERRALPGAYVECGTWRGGAVALMALANLKYGAFRRDIHLFDSFEGAPEPDAAVDGEKAVREARAAGGGATGKLVRAPSAYDDLGGVGSLEQNKELLEGRIGYDPRYLHYHKGWFQETVPADADRIEDIAVLRLDGDWYASTKVCLDCLYDKVVTGGFVIVDDFGCYEGCEKAVHDFFDDRENKPFLSHIDSEGRYFIKG